MNALNKTVRTFEYYKTEEFVSLMKAIEQYEKSNFDFSPLISDKIIRTLSKNDDPQVLYAVVDSFTQSTTRLPAWTSPGSFQILMDRLMKERKDDEIIGVLNSLANRGIASYLLPTSTYSTLMKYFNTHYKGLKESELDEEEKKNRFAFLLALLRFRDHANLQQFTARQNYTKYCIIKPNEKFFTIFFNNFGFAKAHDEFDRMADHIRKFVHHFEEPIENSIATLSESKFMSPELLNELKEEAHFYLDFLRDENNCFELMTKFNDSNLFFFENLKRNTTFYLNYKRYLMLHDNKKYFKNLKLREILVVHSNLESVLVHDNYAKKIEALRLKKEETLNALKEIYPKDEYDVKSRDFQASFERFYSKENVNAFQASYTLIDTISLIKTFYSLLKPFHL